MKDPRQLMQERLNDMNPLMFGDTIRLPMFTTLASNKKLL